MKKSIIRICSFAMVVMMMASSAALADLTRGDRGDDVIDLQQLLFETGWLFELPDGIFGRNTEEAIMNFEEYKGLPVDGIADDQMIYELALDLEALDREQGVVSDYFGEDVVGYFTGENEYDYSMYDTIEFPEYCHQTTDVDGSSHTDYCALHHSLQVDTYYMLESGDPKTAAMASGIWYDEIVNLYDRWAALMPEEDQGSILANRATFLASVEAQRTAANNGDESDAYIVKIETGICQTLRNQAVWLCSMIWEQEKSGSTSDEAISWMPVVLNGSTIIDGDQVYFSGDLEGEGYGIYVMNTDGSNLCKISDVMANLKAVSNGNLLIWRYDGDSYGAMEIMRADGTFETVFNTNCYAIARDGRFYFGGSSVAEDGSDHQWLLSSDPEYHDYFYPFEVDDGYLYYVDVNGSSMKEYFGYDDIPGGDAEFFRLNLETGDIEMITGVGSFYLGMEDGMMYYSREDYSAYDPVSGGTFDMDVDDGLFALDLETLTETMIAPIVESDLVFEYYKFVHDGVLYAEYSDYSQDESVCNVRRIQVDGEELPAIEMGEAVLAAGDGVLCGIHTQAHEDGDYYVYEEYVAIYDLSTGELVQIKLEENESIYFTEITPRIEVVNGRIYYYVQDTTNGACMLKSMNLDGSDVRTLAKTAPLY